MKVLTVIIGDEKYGVDIDFILSIEGNSRFITKIPGQSENIVGVVNIRGDIFPVIDLEKILKGEESDIKNNQKLILIKVGDDRAALLVDDTDNIVDIKIEDVKEKEMNGRQVKIIVQEEEVFVSLDLEYILNSSRINVN